MVGDTCNFALVSLEAVLEETILQHSQEHTLNVPPMISGWQIFMFH